MKIEEAIRQKKFDSNTHKAVLNILYTFHWLTDQMNEAFKSYDITPQQYNVLRILRGRYPNSAPVGDVKEVMLDKNPDMTRLCDRLVLKKLIEREQNDFNRRQILIKITEKGLTLLKKIDPDFKKRSAKWENLTDEEAGKLSDYLDKLRG